MTGNKKLLIIILLVSAFLRLWSLGSGDTLSDEVLYSFRAIGMLDFDEAAEQTTPLEWFDPYIPSWTAFSFHDHPPLVFLVQHIFMRVFGETTFVFRLPSALLGIAAVYFLYLIGKLLYDERAGLVAGAIYGLTVNAVAISRLGLQESYVIFFILLGLFFFLKAEKQKPCYIMVGIVMGLGFLAKYTTGILIPIFITYMLLYRRKDFFLGYLWIGAACAFFLFSPVLYYNYGLYQAVGHFDFQLSFMAGQNPAVWSVQPGKEEFPTLVSRASAFLPNLLKFNSWLFLLAFGASIVVFFFSIAKKIPPQPALLRNAKRADNLPFLKGEVSLFEKGGVRGILRTHSVLLVIFFWLVVLIVGIIGPSLRFLAMLTPFIVLVITQVLTKIPEVKHPENKFRNFIVLVVFIFTFEILYSFNSQLLPYPKGPELWVWSSVRFENYNWGYQELDNFMREKTDGRMPSLAFEAKYHFIEKIHKRALANAERRGKKPLPTLFIYDKNINSIAQLWTLDRLQVYHAWPIITADTYVQFLNDKGENYFKDAGFMEIYYIFPTENVPQKKPPHFTDIGAKLEQALTNAGVTTYTTLENKRSEPVFRIYRKES